MATFGRGRHIVPSIQSVLQQDYPAFELIVVGDNCTDRTEAVVAGFATSGVRWINLPSRCGSQSAPNNAGIKAATGNAIAYIGHDDIWEPNHLRHLANLLDADRKLDFAVAGAIFHLPNGIPGSLVTGLFEYDSAKHVHFFPPSSFAHRKSVCDKIGKWRMPFDIKPPVDADFLLRAAKADLRFASTGKISTQKFAAGHRYLSNLQHSSDEQRDMLEAMKQPDHGRQVAEIIDQSMQHGTYMSMRYPNFEKFEPGDLARQNASRKGNVQRAVALPKHGIEIKLERGYFALDWQNIPDGEIRWTNRNPSPKHLLPYTSASKIEFSFRAFHTNQNALKRITLGCNGRQVSVEGKNYEQAGELWNAEFCVELNLHSREMSVVQFLLDDEQAPSKGRRGIGIERTKIVPVAGLFLRAIAAFKRNLASLGALSH